MLFRRAAPAVMFMITVPLRERSSGTFAGLFRGRCKDTDLETVLKYMLLFFMDIAGYSHLLHRLHG